MQQRGRRKFKKGVVLSNKMDKTVVVWVERTCRHPQYEKVLYRGKKIHAHDESNQLQVGQEVTICECRPISKTKSWRVVAS